MQRMIQARESRRLALLRWSGPAVVLALALSGAGARAGSSDLVAPSPEELDAWRSTAGRVHERLTEFEVDTRAYVDLREKEQRARVSEGFRSPLERVRTTEASQRSDAIQRFEQFLTKHGTEPYSDHVRFRLADLYYEVADEAYVKAVQAFEEKVQAAEAAGDLDALGALGEEPRLDLSKPLAMYEEIVRRNKSLPPAERYERLDGVFLLMGVAYSEERAQQDFGKARDAFRDLIETVPNSQYVDQAHLSLGNFLFQYDARFDDAIAEYTRVFEKGDSGKGYQDALYQLAWSRYKLNQYDEALSLFVQLLDLSERGLAETGKESSFAKDARRFMAFTLADQATIQGRAAIDVADAYFKKIGPRAFERAVYIELSDVLTRYTRDEERLAILIRLQNDPRWRLEADNPVHQQALIELYRVNLTTRDLALGGAAQLELTSRYGEGSEWALSNRANPAALAKARDLIEKNLIDVALEYRVRAQDSGSNEDRNLAIERYQDYLNRFPLSEDYYEQRWAMTATMLSAERWADAERESAILVKALKHHEHDDGAVFSLFQTRYQLYSTSNNPESRAPDAPLERSYTTKAGKVIEVYALDPRSAAVISAADGVMTHPFNGLPVGEEGFKAAAEEQMHALMYLSGQILFYHNRFDEARPRLEAVIQRYPKTDEASFAAKLIVDSYQIEGDLDKVRESLETYLGMSLGSEAVAGTVKESLQGALEDTAYLQAQQLASAEKWMEAADAYTKFVRDFPKSKRTADAVYASALFYEKGGKAERANQAYESFANRFPDDSRSEGIYLFIADNLQATFQLDRAVDYYERLVKRFPSSKNAPVALYNAAFLKIGLKDFLGAAQAFEQYARQYPEEADRETVQFLAGEQYEQVDKDRALRFYEGYLSQYGYQNPDNALEAMWRISEIYREKGNTRQSDAKRADIIKAFDQLASSGKTIGPKGNRYAAEAAFPSIVAAYSAYAKEKLTGNDEKDLKLIKEDKPAALKEFQALADAFVAKYKSTEHISGALFYKASAPLYLADLGLSMAPPKGLSEDDTAAYYEILEQKVYPMFLAFEDAGIARLNELVDLAKRNKFHSKWIDEAVAELNRRRPSDYPAVKRELVGRTDSSSPLGVRAVGMPTAPAPTIAPKPAGAVPTAPPTPPVVPKEGP